MNSVFPFLFLHSIRGLVYFIKNTRGINLSMNWVVSIVSPQQYNIVNNNINRDFKYELKPKILAIQTLLSKLGNT